MLSHRPPQGQGLAADPTSECSLADPAQPLPAWRSETEAWAFVVAVMDEITWDLLG